MKQFILSIALAVLLSGCGYNPDSAVYDTVNNPDGYPSQALTLIEGVQSGRLDSYDSVVATFGDLYTARPELLDDYRWRRVIERLGVQFRLKAETGVKLGIVGYATAARFYDLAAMARPSDVRLGERRELFAGWLKAINDSIIPPGFNPAQTPATVGTELALLKYFVLGDSLHRQFARQYLLPELMVVSSLNKPGADAGASPSDRCFRRLLGLKQELPRIRLGRFSEPTIDLVAAQIQHQAGDWFAAELYFLPHETLTADYLMAFRMTMPDSNLAVIGMPTGHDLAFDFHPVMPTSHWQPGELAGVYRRFRFTGTPVELAVGLYAKGADSAHYLRVEETGERLLALPASTFLSK